MGISGECYICKKDNLESMYRAERNNKKVWLCVDCYNKQETV